MGENIEWPAFLVRSGDYAQDVISKVQQGPETVVALASIFTGRVVGFVNENLTHPSSEPTYIPLVQWTHGRMEQARFGLNCLDIDLLNVRDNVLTPATESTLELLQRIYHLDIVPPDVFDQAGEKLLHTDIKGMRLLRKRQITGKGLTRGGKGESNSLAYSLVFPV